MIYMDNYLFDLMDVGLALTATIAGVYVINRPSGPSVTLRNSTSQPQNSQTAFPVEHNIPVAKAVEQLSKISVGPGTSIDILARDLSVLQKFNYGYIDLMYDWLKQVDSVTHYVFADNIKIPKTYLWDSEKQAARKNMLTELFQNEKFRVRLVEDNTRTHDWIHYYQTRHFAMFSSPREENTHIWIEGNHPIYDLFSVLRSDPEERIYDVTWIEGSAKHRISPQVAKIRDFFAANSRQLDLRSRLNGNAAIGAVPP